MHNCTFQFVILWTKKYPNICYTVMFIWSFIRSRLIHLNVLLNCFIICYFRFTRPIWGQMYLLRSGHRSTLEVNLGYLLLKYKVWYFRRNCLNNNKMTSSWIVVDLLMQQILSSMNHFIIKVWLFLNQDLLSISQSVYMGDLKKWFL